MILPDEYVLAVQLWSGVAVVTFISLFFITAPYGRHHRDGWGPTLPDRTGWILMEAPASLLVLAWFLFAGDPSSIGAWVLMGLWQLHYLHRAFIYPLRKRADGRRIPMAIVGMALIFNSVNSALIGWEVFVFRDYPVSWLSDPRFVGGAVLFLTGYLINKHSDRILRHLRAPGETGHRIPHGGLYRWVSCPNYLGEIIEWIGFAILSWSLAGVAFAAWTIANLAPRAREHHRWYKDRFSDYPASRRALIPSIW
jgi:3-oxo-5-alpha-steroid 4-dehydrogenase 1